MLCKHVDSNYYYIKGEMCDLLQKKYLKKKLKKKKKKEEKKKRNCQKSCPSKKKALRRVAERPTKPVRTDVSILW